VQAARARCPTRRRPQCACKWPPGRPFGGTHRTAPHRTAERDPARSPRRTATPSDPNIVTDLLTAGSAPTRRSARMGDAVIAQELS
jgi:hypothetical protein